MKRLLALVILWTLLVITGTLVSADGQTRAGAAADGKRAVAIGAGAGAAGSYLYSRHRRY